MISLKVAVFSVGNVGELYRSNRLRTKAIIIIFNIYLLLIMKKFEFWVTAIFFSILCIVKVLKHIAGAVALV